MRGFRVFDLDFLIERVGFKSGFWFRWGNVGSRVRFFGVFGVCYDFFEEEVINMIILSLLIYGWALLLFFKFVEDIFLVFLIVKKGSEARRGLFKGEGFFLDELSGCQWIIEFLDVMNFGIDLAQESCVSCVSHITFNVKVSLIIC